MPSARGAASPVWRSHFGPLVGGAIIQGIAWQWIFWLNVPIGVLLIPLALSRLKESYGPEGRLDLPGLGLVSAGLFGIVWGLVRGNSVGWASPQIVTALLVGLVLVAAFVAWELRTDAPMLPMRFFRNATFALANTASLFMYFGMFGSIFLLAQFFQTVQGYSPLGSGLRFLPWTLAPMFIAPLAGALSDKIPAKNMIGVGLAMQAAALAWMASVATPTTPYSQLIGPFIVAGVGMALFFAPVANLVLSAVRPEEEGKSSGANNAIRELGGVFGVAVLASIFAHVGGYGTGQSFVDGMNPALFVGAGVVALGALAAFMIPRRPRVEALEAEPSSRPSRSSPTRQKPPDRPFRYATRTAPRRGRSAFPGPDHRSSPARADRVGLQRLLMRLCGIPLGGLGSSGSPTGRRPEHRIVAAPRRRSSGAPIKHCGSDLGAPTTRTPALPRHDRLHGHQR